MRGGTHVRATPRGSSTGESGDGRQPGVLVGHLPRLLARSAATAQLLVCDISYWEVATKAARRRLLIAAAQLFAAPLVTVDERIIAYAKVQGGVPVCDARR